MTHAKWLVALIAVFSFTTISAQHLKKTTPQQQGSNSDQANAAGSNRPEAGDTTAAAPAGDLNPATEKQSGNTTHASGLMEHTSSPSGSPSLLSDESGTKRDGTNNVQRATMNMVGSPVRNMSLSKNVVNVSEEVRKTTKSVSETSAKKGSDQINDKTRRESNNQSDQNLSSKNRGAKIIQESSRKKDRRKNKKG